MLMNLLTPHTDAQASDNAQIPHTHCTNRQKKKGRGDSRGQRILRGVGHRCFFLPVACRFFSLDFVLEASVRILYQKGYKRCALYAASSARFAV